MLKKIEDWLYERTSGEIAAFNLILTVVNVLIILVAVIIRGK